MKTTIARTTLALVLCFLVQHCVADFAGVCFDSITEGDSLNLTWNSDGLDSGLFPLVITVSLINQTNAGVYGVKTDLSSKYHPVTKTLTADRPRSNRQYDIIFVARASVPGALPANGTVSGGGQVLVG